jgi:hypothetical protein
MAKYKHQRQGGQIMETLIKTEEEHMKIKSTVVMGYHDVAETSFQGYMPEGTRYEDIIRIFGEPQRGVSRDGKIKAEWIGKINGIVFEIYDYKSDIAPELNTDWHISGKTKRVVTLVNSYFKRTRGEI